MLCRVCDLPLNMNEGMSKYLLVLFLFYDINENINVYIKSLTFPRLSLSSLVHPAHLRDGNEDAREGAPSPLHARLRTSRCHNTHTHIPPYAFLPSRHFCLTYCVCVRPLFLLNPTVCISVDRPGCVRGKRWERLKCE